MIHYQDHQLPAGSAAFAAGQKDALGQQGSYANLFHSPEDRAAYEAGYHGAKLALLMKKAA